ncbi:hypothetical protein FIU97_12590 [Roseivivax sp. THAF40]|uniref:DUF5681 domain-containing protein n=1 Tax=Roseivivax sp. THAF40 TaxID=2587858 RepID=UPI001268CB2F|nr:DUF5681 domain-containing protein [Roseivivax sp. THAF40]QFT47414.1 hypothetical protein FIU97_12590 [Roseivivax sp. THAF40]
MSQKNDGDYEIGYGRPPKATQFQKGQSGNPKGRPRTAKNVGSMLEETFFRKIPITENGSRLELTLIEAILRQLANGAAKGELRHIDRVLKLLPMLQEARMLSLAGGEEVGQGDPQADMAVLEALADMFGSDPEQLFATVQGGIDDDRHDT